MASMPLTIYGHWVSQPSRAIMWALKVKSVPFQFVEVDPLSGGTRKPEYLTKFQSGTIPAMEDGTVCIFESGAIFLHLAEKYGWTDLYPKDPVVRAQIHQYLFWHGANTRLFSADIFRPTLVAALQKKPFPELNATQQKTLARVFGSIEKWLSEHQFLVGDSLTIADFACYCEIDQLIYGEMYDLSKYPQINRWVGLMKQVPHHEEAHVGLAKLTGFVKKQKQSKL